MIAEREKSALKQAGQMLGFACGPYGAWSCLKVLLVACCPRRAGRGASLSKLVWNVTKRLSPASRTVNEAISWYSFGFACCKSSWAMAASKAAWGPFTAVRNASHFQLSNDSPSMQT